MARASLERKPSTKAWRPRRCWAKCVLLHSWPDKNILPGKIIPEPATVCLFHQIHLISQQCLWGRSSFFPSSHSIYCHMHVLKETKKCIPKWKDGDKFGDCWSDYWRKKAETLFFFFLKLWLAFGPSSPCPWLYTFQFSNSWISDLIMVMIVVICWLAT